MPTSKTTIDNTHTTIGEIRAFVTAFRTKLEAVGFVTTSDTGQYDEATGPGVGASNTLTGHKILRTPDSDPSNSVLPIYTKARVRNGYASNFNQTVSPHFGTGSDGASNLTDLWTPHNDSIWMQLPIGDPLNMWVVRNSLMGGFVIGGVESDNYDYMAAGWFFHRTVDSIGNPTTDGYYALTFTYVASQQTGNSITINTGTNDFVFPGVLTTSGQQLVWIAATENYYDRTRDKWRGESHPLGGGHKGFRIPDYPSVSIDGNNTVHRPYIGDKFDGLDRPLTGLVAYHKAHHAVGDTFTLSRYGVDRTFLATALRICHASYGNNKLDWRLAVLWE